MERINGFLKFNTDTKLWDSEEESCWLRVDNKNYFFKVADEKFLYRELFSEEIAKALNIKTVNYDLAIVNGKKGVISEDFNPDKRPIITLNKIENDYLKKVLIPNKIYNGSGINNLEDIWDALKYYYKNDDIVFKLMKEIIDAFILQICIGNGDLHGLNIQIFDDDKPSLVPNFDYGFSLFFPIDRMHYFLEVTNDYVSAKKEIDLFFQSSFPGYRKYFRQKINLMPRFIDLLNIVQKKIQYLVPLEMKGAIELNYESYYNYLHSLVWDEEKINKL